jgi:hypothetical protein
MFQGDPENKPFVAPQHNEFQKKNIKKNQEQDSLQRQLDGLTKKKLSNPSSIKIADLSYWTRADRNEHTINPKFQPKYMFQDNKRKNVSTDDRRVRMDNVSKNQPVKKIVNRDAMSYDPDTRWEEKQVEKYYQGVMRRNMTSKKKYAGDNPFKYTNWAILLLALGLGGYFLYTWVIKQ